ncbi:integrase core domain-containing protein [Candidatus Poriferisodalis sp.]|uniref:integrase core domain-containing protein n=1 Tax=Candidatus Poriferisodalis sp. TaxID=3101277 RepID=UPI003C6F2866
MSATGTAGDLCAAFDASGARAGELLGHALIEDCTDPDTGETAPVVIVTDNGPATKSAAAARWFAARPHFAHVRTRHRSPHTNGVIERWFEALKYERPCRHDIADRINLAAHAADYIDEYNRVRPHENLDWARPLDAHPQAPTLKQDAPETEQQTMTRDSLERISRDPGTFLGLVGAKAQVRGVIAVFVACLSRQGR